METSFQATEVLDAEFPQIRARLLQVAAQLDRLNRATGDISADPRMAGIQKAIAVLSRSESGRAEQIQLLFSQPYDPDWKEKFDLARR